MMDFVAAVKKLLAPLERRVASLAVRGLLQLVDDGQGIQIVQVTMEEGRPLDGVERFQPFGLSSVPMAGAEAVVVCVGGYRHHAIALMVDDRRYRPQSLKPGETIVYDIRGQRVYLSEDGIVFDGAGLPITFTNTPKVRMESSLEVVGDVTDHCDSASPRSMAGMRTVFNAHDHADPQGGRVLTPDPSHQM